MKFTKWALLAVAAVVIFLSATFMAAWVVTFGWAIPGCHGVC